MDIKICVSNKIRFVFFGEPYFIAVPIIVGCHFYFQVDFLWHTHNIEQLFD